MTGLADFDAGCFGAQTANQVAIVSIDPPQSGNYSSVYLTLYYTAGAIGSSLVTPILINLGMGQSGSRRSCFARSRRAHPIAKL